MSHKQLTGVHGSVVTPLRADGQLDVEAVDRILDAVVEAGADGVCVNGSVGEGPLSSREQRCEMVGRAASTGRFVHVMSGVFATSTDQALRELSRVAEAGATLGLLTAPLFYDLGEDEVARFVEFVAERAAIPLALYAIPAFGSTLPVSAVARLAAHPNVIGMKDSTGDAEYGRSVLTCTEDRAFSYLLGSEALIGDFSLRGRADGYILAAAGVVPELVVRALGAGDDEGLAAIQRLAGECRALGRPFGWKVLASLLGLCELLYLPPVTPPSDRGKFDALARVMSELEMPISRMSAGELK